MTTSEIPEKAVETLNVALGWNPQGPLDEVSRRALQAVAPYIKAQALRDEAARLGAEGHVVESAFLQRRADELEAQA